MNHLKDIFDFEGAKVMLATATPFVVWGTQLELVFKLIIALGSAVYVWRKALSVGKDK